MRGTRLVVSLAAMGVVCLAGALTAVFPPVGIAAGATAGATLLLRRLTFTVTAYLGAAVFADYISSWLPLVAGFPAGAIVRDYLGLTILLAGASVLAHRSHRPPAGPSTIAGAAIRGSQLPLLLLWALTCALVVGAPSLVPGLLGARNILLYPTVAVVCWVLVERGKARASTIRNALVLMFSVAAVLGVLDAATNGHILALLGYSQSFAGTDVGVVAGQGAAVLGVGRANGGIANALVYGYLMATVAVFAIYRAFNLDGSSHRRVKTAGYLWLATIAALACALSLTRGAIVALVLGVLILIIRRRSARLTSSALLLAALIGFAIVAFGPADVIVSRLRAQDISSQLSNAGRVGEFATGIDGLLRQPLGQGLGTEGSASLRGGNSIVGDIYLLIVALQVGILGILAFLLVLGSWMVAALRSAQRDGALLSALIAMYVVAATLSGSPDAPVYSAPFWLLLVLAGNWSAGPPTTVPAGPIGLIRDTGADRGLPVRAG